MVLLEEAIPPVRDEALCRLRGRGQCMVCALNRDLVGFECGLGIPEKHKRVQYGGGMALGGFPSIKRPLRGFPLDGDETLKGSRNGAHGSHVETKPTCSVMDPAAANARGKRGPSETVGCGWPAARDALSTGARGGCQRRGTAASAG